MAKLESIFLELLSNRDYNYSALVEKTRSITDVNEDKIKKRLNKLMSVDKLYSYNENMISSESPAEIGNLKFDEEYDYGFFKLARKGKQTFLFSSSNSGLQHEKMDFMKKKLPELEIEVEQLYRDIETVLINNCNPLDALGHVSYKNLTCNPDEYTESSCNGKPLLVEILQNIILKHDSSAYPENSDFEKLNDLEVLLDKLWNKLVWIIIYESSSKDDLSFAENHVYFKTISHFLFVRGAAYSQHYEHIAKELFYDVDHILIKKGFNINEYFDLLKEIDEQIDSNLKEIPKNYELVDKLNKKEYEFYVDFVKKGEEEGKQIEDIYKEYQQVLPNRKEKIQPYIDKISKISPKDIGEINLTKNINKGLLNSLSLCFNSVQNWSSPFDTSDVPLKPIIKINDKYYCFLSQHLIQNVIPIIESFITSESEKTEYGEIKGNYFETKSLQLMQKMLPTSTTYKNLYYPKDSELDGLIIYKDNLFLIEVKGKKRRCIACAKDILMMTKEDVESQLSKTFEQSKKVLKYIKSRPKVDFKTKDKKVISIEQNDFKNIFLINITADSFSEFSTDLNILKSWDPALFKGDVYPWNVNIYDLLVITDLLDNQDDFVDYLSERIRLNYDMEIKSGDELDFFGYFLKYGSLSKAKDIEGKTIPTIIGYTEDIDRWYSYERGEINFAEKPKKQ